MALDSITEVTSKSWLTRLIDSIKSVALGLLLFLAAFPTLFWNEGCSVRNYKALKEGATAAVVVDSAAVVPANEGKLVFTTGRATTTDTLSDPIFNVSTSALRLERVVQMYQWTEKSTSEKTKKLGGSEETTSKYTYELAWSAEPKDSSKFKEPKGHTNPPMAFAPDSWTANTTLGAFTVPANLVSSINTSESLPAPADAVAKFPADLKARTTAEAAGTYFVRAADSAGKPEQPALGDLRISFRRVLPTDVSVVASQSGPSFAPFATSVSGAYPIYSLKVGRLTKDAMFGQLQAENTTRTWIIRGVGFAMMFVGLMLVFQPFVIVADFIPLLGSLLGGGVAIFAFLVAMTCSLITIAVAWIFYRPLLGIGLFILAVAAIYFLIARARSKAKAKKLAVQPATA